MIADFRFLKWLRGLFGGETVPTSLGEQVHAALVKKLQEETMARRQSEERNAKFYAELMETRKLLSMPFEARESESAPPWDDEDRNNWRKFLATSTGERVRRLMNYWSQVKAQEATARHDKHEYACGIAAGWQNEGEFLFHRLSADLPPQTEGDTQPGQGAADLRERMAP